MYGWLPDGPSDFIDFSNALMEEFFKLHHPFSRHSLKYCPTSFYSLLEAKSPLNMFYNKVYFKSYKFTLLYCLNAIQKTFYNLT